MRGANVQMTKLCASKGWWIGGGMCSVPVIGLKSSALKTKG